MDKRNELALLQSFEQGELLAIASEQETATLRSASRATVVNSKRDNIRL